MSGFPIRSPFGRLFNGSGAAGPRRLIIIGGLTVLALGVVALISFHDNSPSAPPTVVARAPRVDPLPGGPHATPVYSDLALREAQEKAAKAAALGLSSVAEMPGGGNAVAPPPPAGAVAQPVIALPTPPPYHPPATPLAAPQLTTLPARNNNNDDQTKVYSAAIASLLAGWGSKPQQTEIILPPQSEQAAGGTGPGGIDQNAAGSGAARRQVSYADGRDGASPAPIPNARRLPQVLMPAGRGVYGRTVLAVSSDQGGPVVVEALSGPIAGDRMTGGFERRDDRLVVHLDSITLQDGTVQRIEALVIAPDTMETAVASSVDQHYLSRFVLPVAAAFVQGLGQAISQSNSTVIASPFGGATAFQNLNLNQQLGVAAGVAASQFGAAVKEAAPKGPTVKMDANVNVGVVFLAPLVVGGDH